LQPAAREDPFSLYSRSGYSNRIPCRVDPVHNLLDLLGECDLLSQIIERFSGLQIGLESQMSFHD